MAGAATAPNPVLLLAGPTRRRDDGWPPRRDGPRWFEPLHVREPEAVRRALAAQVAAGAQVIVAPAHHTHRRALAEIGESRRVREWTAAAVQVAREAVEEGLEERATALAAGPAPGSDRDDVPDEARLPRAPSRGVPSPDETILVAGPLPSPRLDVARQTGDGRQPAARHAGEQASRDQAGILADAGADLVLMDGEWSLSDARLGLSAVHDAGLPAWVVARLAATGGHDRIELASGDVFDAWLEQLLELGAAAVLLEGERAADVEPALARIGGTAGAPLHGVNWAGAPPDDAMLDRVASWLDAGSGLVGIAEAATPERVAALRRRLDVVLADRDEARAAGLTALRERIAEAAHGAPGGPALWLAGPDAPSVERPSGFAWTVAPPEALASLPAAHYRLVVGLGDVPDPERLAALVEPGGILAARLDRARPPRLDGLRTLDPADERTGEAARMTIFRRDR